MSDDKLPEPAVESSGALDRIKDIIGEINLPKLIAGPAGEAISRLIAGGADIPAAWLEQKAKSIRDKTAGKSQISNTLANAASELVKNDPGLVQRAADSLIAKELRRQHNRETVAVRAIEYLKETPDAQTTNPTDDWLNMFAQHAQQASSDRLQDMWARVLAGELRKPHSFSLQTLRFISELDEEIATLFEKYSPRIANGDMIGFPAKQGQEFSELMTLEDCGLVSGIAGNVTRTWRDDISPEKLAGNIILPFKDYVFVAIMERPYTVVIPCVILTRVGREIYRITKSSGTAEAVQEMVENFPKAQVQRIMRLPKTEGGVAAIVWEKPVAT